MNKLTIEEVKQDLEWSQADLEDLHQIVGAIRRFTTQQRGEDRRSFRMDLMRWEALEAECRNLNTVIDSKLRALTGAPYP